MDTVSAAPRKRTANFFLIIKFLLDIKNSL
jgi:hypothetical protein